MAKAKTNDPLLWAAWCEKCGFIDRMPNGGMAEAAAKVHCEDTGHKTICGLEYSLVED